MATCPWLVAIGKRPRCKLQKLLPISKVSKYIPKYSSCFSFSTSKINRNLFINNLEQENKSSIWAKYENKIWYSYHLSVDASHCLRSWSNCAKRRISLSGLKWNRSLISRRYAASWEPNINFLVSIYLHEDIFIFKNHM